MLRRGRAVAGPTFLVRGLPNGTEGPRLGIVASRRAFRRAVSRNYCKRLVREVFRAAKEFLAGTDVVVVCRREVLPGDRKAVREELAALLRGLGTGHAPLRSGNKPPSA